MYSRIAILSVSTIHFSEKTQKSKGPIFVIVERNKYIEELIQTKDKKDIKIVTGLKGIGKSAILSQFINTLKERFDVANEQIIEFNFNDKVLLSTFT
jgi:predicted AAA+ superfamily ATPase